MCSIAGLKGTYPEGMYQQLTLMLAQMIHRGDSPFEMGNVGDWCIGTNRLKILDPENGTQPFLTKDGLMGCLLNGQIFNHHELRAELATRGIICETSCDTEVVLRGYIEFGPDFIGQLDGMFAIALVDGVSNKCFLARDSFGQKPLLVCVNDEKLGFASEVKAFPYSYYQEVNEYPPGCYGFIGEDPVAFYDYPPTDDSLVMSNSLLREIRDTMMESVWIHCRDLDTVPVLFGAGIDSSIVLAGVIASDKTPVCYTLGSDFSEDASYARRLCDELGCKMVQVKISRQDIFNAIFPTVRLVEGSDRNLVRGSILSYLLGCAVRSYGHRVALCGEGCDEIFAGYADFASCKSSFEIDRLVHEFTRSLHNSQLRRVDRVNMGVGLEVRSPFLGRNISHLALTIPGRLKVKHPKYGPPVTKWILREAFRGVLPDYIIDRPKTTLNKGAGFDDMSSDQGAFVEAAYNMLENLPGDHPKTMARDEAERFLYQVILSRIYPNLPPLPPTRTTRAPENILRDF